MPQIHYGFETLTRAEIENHLNWYEAAIKETTRVESKFWEPCMEPVEDQVIIVMALGCYIKQLIEGRDAHRDYLNSEWWVG